MSNGRAIGLEAMGITKRFGSLTALQDVGMKIAPGHVHALLGENGAGKSTLVKCIMGYYQADDGQFLVDEREQEVTNPREAHTLGIGMVYQHFTLVPKMTVAENLVMSRADVPMRINWAREYEDLRAFMAATPFQIPLDAQVADLSAGQKQKVEILKQLYLDGRFLILDEPTSVLTPQEADEVLGLLRGMAQEGRLTILLITHKFREVRAFCDTVTVLRRGRQVGGGNVADFTTDQLAEMMVGGRAPTASALRTNGHAPAVCIELKGVTAHDNAGAVAANDVNLTVSRGEIVGIAGVSGNGQSELVEVLAGQRLTVSGEVRIKGEVYVGRREQMARLKVFSLPEEPLRNAVVPRMSVAENMAFRTFDAPPFARGGWWLHRGAMRAAARRLIDSYQVKTPTPDTEIGHLSGGNIQRSVLARELSGDVEVLIVANPCFGLDFAAVAEIRDQIMQARNRGVAVLLVSEDLDELLELSDRIAVMSGGEVVYETPIAEAEINTIGRYMAGH